MRELRTEVEINAPVAPVWDALMDFKGFSDWNPFIQGIQGLAVEGQRLQVQIVAPGGQSMTFQPTVTQVKSEREFRWLGHFGIPGLFDGEHIFELESLENQCTKFIHRECFRGILVPLFWGMLNSQTRQGFEQMNRSLKQYVERERDILG